MNKRAITIVVLICIMPFLFLGCANVNNATPSPSPIISITPNATIPPTIALSPQVSVSPGILASSMPNASLDPYQNNQSVTPTESLEMRQVLETTKKVAGVTDAVAAVYANKCVIGIKLKSGSDETTVKAAVAEAIRNLNIRIDHIAVTSDAALYQEIQTLYNSPDAAFKIDSLLGTINQ